MLRARDVVFVLERVPDVGRIQFAPRLVRHPLHGLGEVRLHALGKLQALVLFQHPGEAALAGLRVDADHRLVIAAEVSRVDRQVGNAPVLVVLLLVRLEPLLDRVLVAAGKRGEDQFAAIGMALVHGDLVAVFDRLDHLVDVREVEARVHALRVHVQRNGHEAAIARPLAIPEQAAFDPVRARHDAQLRRRDAGAAVVMGVERDHRAVPVGQVAAEILDLVGVDVGRRAFDRGGQVQDDRPIGRRLQDVHHRLAAFEAEVQFGGAEGFRAVFEVPLGIRILRGLVADDLGARLGNAAHFVLAHLEDDVAPGGADRVVDVDDRLLRADQAFEAARNKVFAALRQHLHQHVVGDAARMDEALNEIEFGRARGGKTDLDFLQAHLDQLVEEAGLLHAVHRVDQRLVAVAHVGRQPARRLGDRLRRPGAIGQVDGREGAVFDRRVGQHGAGRGGHDGYFYSAVSGGAAIVPPGRPGASQPTSTTVTPRGV